MGAARLAVLLALAQGCWSQCALPEHPANGRHSPVETYCPPHEWHVPRCQSVPETTVPDGWLLSVKCDDGFVLNTLENSYSQSSCADGRWLPPLASCVYSYTNDKHKCVAPPYPKNGKYDPLPIECAANDKNTEDLILPGAFVPSMCVLLYSCNSGYERAENDVISICERGEWKPGSIVCRQKSNAGIRTNTKPPNSGTALANVGAGCALPAERANRNYCTFGCDDCVRGSCTYAPGSTVNDYVIIKCDPGYRSSENNEQSTNVCINGQWSQDFPQCLRLCPPLSSDALITRCTYGASTVDCHLPMLPGTSATYQCRDSHREYSDLTEAGVYKRTIYCKQDGWWTYQLPECEPICGISKEGSVTPTVVNGKPTKLGAFPWHAGLFKYDGKVWNCVCGGSLLTNRIVITAAHCVHLTKLDILRVAMGKLYRTWDRDEETAVKRNISRIVMRPEYKGVSSQYGWDVALLLLSESVQFDSFVMPVCRDTKLEFDLYSNNHVQVVGWGKTSANGVESEVLLQGDIDIMPPQYCQRRIYQPLLFDKFCGVKNGVSTAEQGDSGGGLTAPFNNLHYLFGIVSTKVNSISMFTNVSWENHKTWIDTEMNKLNTFVN